MSRFISSGPGGYMRGRRFRIRNWFLSFEISFARRIEKRCDECKGSLGGQHYIKGIRLVCMDCHKMEVSE